MSEREREREREREMLTIFAEYTCIYNTVIGWPSTDTTKSNPQIVVHSIIFIHKYKHSIDTFTYTSYTDTHS